MLTIIRSPTNMKKIYFACELCRDYTLHFIGCTLCFAYFFFLSKSNVFNNKHGIEDYTHSPTMLEGIEPRKKKISSFINNFLQPSFLIYKVYLI